MALWLSETLLPPAKIPGIFVDRVLPSTIRHYTEIGLLKVKELTEGGYRLYEKEDVLDRLSMVKEAREGTKELMEIKAMIN